ncbi:mechanosensitive ion channel family protein [Acanthopleuribacter pedis]|uniref:Mechanosensitive ion channel family protein n=1 Tax=Acanthopleuribacter pedis TaxID=442870 RepID=A0A8J7QDE6_9BACT|nr:mechanosensitive ion channel family protein [Acanthopleuribacter pedis]MBO1322089.1 mechanosensitive ion channel family protein [Acanthopleuribacter pedis]
MDELWLWLDKPWVASALTMGGGVLVALLIRVLSQGSVKRLAKRTKTRLDDQILEIFQGPLTLTIVVVAFIQAYNILGLAGHWRTFAFGGAVTLAVVSWMIAALHFAGALIDWFGSGDNPHRIVQPKTKPLFLFVYKTLVVAFAVYFIILAWGQDLSAWLASAGIAGIAIGLASKDTLANFISGIFIIADSPFKIGDFIVLDNGDRGRVTHIGIRSTRLMTPDDVEVIIPNAVMGNSTIINQSGGPYEKFRLRVPVSVAYGSDIDQVRGILMSVAEKGELVEQIPKPRVRFRELGDSGLLFEIWVWVREPVFQEDVRDQMLTESYKALNQAKITIPFPQMDVHIKEVPRAADA